MHEKTAAVNDGCKAGVEEQRRLIASGAAAVGSGKVVSGVQTERAHDAQAETALDRKTNSLTECRAAEVSRVVAAREAIL